MEHFAFDLLEEGVVFVKDTNFLYLNKSACEHLKISDVTTILNTPFTSIFSSLVEEVNRKTLVDAISCRYYSEKVYCGSEDRFSIKIAPYSETVVCCIIKLCCEGRRRPFISSE